jgi:tRNA A58 N-methylase Trm61
MSSYRRIRLIFALIVLTRSGPVMAQTSAPATSPATSAPEKLRYTFRTKHDPNGIGKFYMGREIAQVMGHEAADWLERPEREKEEDPAKLMAALNVQPGDVVADIGAGTGFYTMRLAKLVGARGKVKAVDIQQEMLDLLKKRMNDEKIENVDLILGKESDPQLEPGTVDLVLMVDVYHEFAYPFEMMEHIVAALKPTGRVVFVEFRLEDPKVPIKLVHKMNEQQVVTEMRVVGLRRRQAIETLPWQHILIFEKKPFERPRPYRANQQPSK